VKTPRLFSKAGLGFVWSMAAAQFRKGGRRSQPYKGAEVSRLNQDWIIAPISTNAAIRQSGRMLRTRARDLARNNSYIKQFLALLAMNVIGPKGMRLQAQVRNNDKSLATSLNNKIEAAWLEWSLRPTVTMQGSLKKFARMIIKCVAKDGEAFIRMVLGYAGNRFMFGLQQIDPTQIDYDLNRKASPGHNEIRLGVEVDGWGAAVAYHIATQDINDSTMHKRVERIPADKIIHLYDPEDANQTRGVSWLNCVMLPIKMLEGYAEAELVASRTAAAKMGWLEPKGEDAYEPPEEGDDKQPIEFEASPGTVEMLPAGLEFKEWSSDHPTTAFSEFMKGQLRTVASGLHTSYNALASDLENVNFSSLRSGLLIERDVWKTIQDWMADDFYTVIYWRWLEAALLSGALVLDSRDFRKFLAVKWLPRGWAWVDPLKDTQANILGVGNGLATRTELLAERGTDLETVLNTLAEEQKLAKDLDVNISAGAAKPAAASASPDKETGKDDEGEDVDEDKDGEAGDKALKPNGTGIPAATNHEG